jgi:tetratricopeptide (TPR) repeat protein
MGEPLRIFISYSHDDKRHKKKLLDHLSVLVEFSNIDPWTDDRIAPGAKWREEIEQAMASCDVALLLVSASFLASKFIKEAEIPALWKRQADARRIVVPVILSDCAWKYHPALEPLSALPADGKPITEYAGNKRERAFKQVAEAIATLARKRAEWAPQDRPGAAHSPAPHIMPATPASSGSALHQLRAPPGDVTERPRKVITNVELGRREEELIGRGALLERVHDALSAPTGRGVVLYGMTGLGKTWIAQAVAATARRDHTFPGGVFWVSGDSRKAFLEGLASIGAALDQCNLASKSGEEPNDEQTLVEEAPRDEAPEMRIARDALRNAEETILLVVDQIDPRAPWVKEELEPLARATRVLATTTHAPMGFLHGPGRAAWLPVDPLEHDDAYGWVRSLAPRLHQGEIDALLAFFERHTLALDVAARTLDDDPLLPVSRYLDALRAGRDWTDEPEVNGAGRTALQALRFLSEHTTPEARRAWALSGCFASAPIPVGWLRAALAVLGLSDSEARAGVKELVRRHLGVRVGEGSGMTLPLHPLVHIVARTLATDTERSAMAQGLVQWIPGLEDSELHLKVPPAWPHIEAAWEAAAADPLVALRLTALLKYRGHRADLNRAREMLEATIKVAEQIEGPRSEVVAAVCNGLGCILMEFGSRTCLEEAEPILRRAIAIGETPLARDTPTVAVRLSNLAMVLKNLGGLPRLEEAEILIRRALDIDEQALGENAPPVAVRLGNLAMVLKNLGGPERLDEAEGLLRRAVKIQQRALGPDSPTVAVTLSNLAMVLEDLGEQGRHEEAEMLLRRALDIRENALGLDSPRVAVTLHNLAMVLLNLGGEDQLEEAEALLRRALTIEENALGADAPKVAVTLCNLASVLKMLSGARAAHGGDPPARAGGGDFDATPRSAARSDDDDPGEHRAVPAGSPEDRRQRTRKPT